MKKAFLFSFVAFSTYYLVGQEYIESIPRGSLTIINQSNKLAFFWFAGYVQVGKKSFKKWHPNYNPEKKTVQPLILPPGKGVKINVPENECFFWMYAWWGAGYDKADTKIEAPHRCRNVTVYIRGTKKLDLPYEVELTQQEIEEREQKKQEEAEGAEEGVLPGMDEQQPAYSVEEEPPFKKRKGYFV